MNTNLRRFLVLGLVLATSAGCKVTSEDIEYWKGTVKGPGKIVSVMLAERYPMDLRTDAALALVEMERQDRDGVAMLQQAIQRLQDSDPDAVTAIIDGMLPRLQELMVGSDDANQNPDLGPPPLQTRAKDAAYLLITHAGPETRAALVDAVVDWYSVDFANRSLAGNYSVEQVVRSIGAPAATRLVNAMNSHQPQQALVKVAELIGQLGDAETKQTAGERLVAIEREMEGQEFFEWLKSQISESLEGSGREADENFINRTALINRENFINQGALPAMKNLASVEAVRNRLLEIATTAPAEDASEPVKISMNLRRQRALQALEGNATEEQLDQLLAIALAEGNPIHVRDYAFDRVGDIRSRSAIPQLWPLVQNAENEDLKKRLRWRAGELVLGIGGAEVVAEFFTKLPTDEEVQYEPEELEGYATRMSQMTPQPVDVVERQLSSRNWFARVIALNFIARRGTAADVSKLEQLRGDETEVVGSGWERREVENVGKVAENAITQLRERLTGPEEGSSDGGGDMSASAME